jgi:hypothetical protein
MILHQLLLSCTHAVRQIDPGRVGLDDGQAC